MRRLTLKKDTLTELTTDELGGVAGGSFPSKYDCTESYQVCNPLSRDVCIDMQATILCLPTRNACFTTEGCG